jgi:hypothetical protein
MVGYIYCCGSRSRRRRIGGIVRQDCIGRLRLGKSQKIRESEMQWIMISMPLVAVGNGGL